MAKLIILSGIPGSGKSTFAKEYNEGPLVILSTDNIRRMITGDAGCLDKDDVMWKYIYEILAKPHVNATYIVDATNLVFKRRKSYLEYHRNFDTVELIYLHVDLQTALERNAQRDRHVPEHVIKNMYEMASANMNFMELLDAGYDKVTVIKNI